MMRTWLKWLVMLTFSIPFQLAFAQVTVNPEITKGLTSFNSSAILASVEQLGQSGSPYAEEVLLAMASGQVKVNDQGQIFLEKLHGSFVNLTDGASVSNLPENVKKIRLNNRLRLAITNALAYSQVFSENDETRLLAVKALQTNIDIERLPLLIKARSQEVNADIALALDLSIASANLQSKDNQQRIKAIVNLGESGQGQFIQTLMPLLRKNDRGQFVEPLEIRQATEIALKKIEYQLTIESWLGNIFFGLSLGSILLLVALGLAITFGLMGVINMAHGELLMIGAYSTYVVQTLFKQWFPSAFDWYVIAALPVAFIVTALVGMVLERTVIRWLYGRPLETLLATWGVSLILMQLVRTIFGAQNVEVANPSWMSGGLHIMGSLVISYNRISIFLFALLVVLFVWIILQYTRLGLFVRAITQNRQMANCVGVPTGRIDMLTFGLGAGIAGLAGVALSQLGNVGPDLGRTYIIDSFMVVVLGGVGQLAGTVIAALGLGALNKFMEPFSGAVVAKITILMFIILFIQKRPQGIFAPKGRGVE
jgi:urea transport system permease protein